MVRVIRISVVTTYQNLDLISFSVASTAIIALLLQGSRNLRNPCAHLATSRNLWPATYNSRARFYRDLVQPSDVLYSSSAELESQSPSDGQLSRPLSRSSLTPSPILEACGLLSVSCLLKILLSPLSALY